jgi:hypothetical protein
MANTLNWTWPATAAVDPTAAQVVNQNSVAVVVTLDGTGTTITLNHNLGISAADLLLGFPTVVITPAGLTAANGTSAARVTSVTANTVVLTFITAVAAVYNIVIERPHTLKR